MNFDAFWRALADLLGVHDSAYDSYRQFMSTWQPFEGGWSRNNAQFNPMNTTHIIGSSNPINSVGVQSYPDVQTGAQATADTLNNGRYPTLVTALQTGDYSNQPAIQADINTWVTGSPSGSAYNLFSYFTPPVPAPSPTHDATPVIPASLTPSATPAQAFVDQDKQGHMWSDTRNTWIDRWGNWLRSNGLWSNN